MEGKSTQPPGILPFQWASSSQAGQSPLAALALAPGSVLRPCAHGHSPLRQGRADPFFAGSPRALLNLLFPHSHLLPDTVFRGSPLGSRSKESWCSV